MIILGIETSCDETAAAIVEAKRPPTRRARAGGRFIIRSNVVSSQIAIHRPYGGVVPELAARDHIKHIIPVISRALAAAKVAPRRIDRIAVTTGPGLITSLLVGSQTAKTLAYLWHKPIVSVNHLRAHLYAAWLGERPVRFPALGLIVSGGHTELILLHDSRRFKKIGQTIDDAAGEAFDKVAALLGLSYPGGPAVAASAKQGDAAAFTFPRPMMKSPDFNFSFAGLKTAVIYTANRKWQIANGGGGRRSKLKADISASFQQAVVDVLVSKTVAAAKRFKVKTVILSGGVAANRLLRSQMGGATRGAGIAFVVPDFKFCTDNAVMIAVAGFFGKPTPWQKVEVDPNWEIG